MKILLADDHILFKDALNQFIKALRPTWKLTLCSDLDQAYKFLENDNSYDLILLDLRMPGMNGLDGLKQIKSTFSDLVIGILSGVAEEQQIKKAINLGAQAYFPKTLSGKSLINAIETLMRTGQPYIPLSPDGTKIMPSYYDDKYNNDHHYHKALLKLTKREKEVLLFLAQGFSNQNIADNMAIQVATVKLHVSGVCKKLKVDNRTQAAIIAHKSSFSRNQL